MIPELMISFSCLMHWPGLPEYYRTEAVRMNVFILFPAQRQCMQIVSVKLVTDLREIVIIIWEKSL